jgi:large subunit ribosomal protein L33
MRDIITLQCGDCKNRNYTTTKNKKKHTERLETKKFCNTCRKQTAHKEVKYGFWEVQASGVFFVVRL